MDARPERRYTWHYTSRCPRAAVTAGGVATKGLASMRYQRTARRGCAPAEHAAPSSLYFGVEEPRCR
jgi:hypothetical protein